MFKLVYVDGDPKTCDGCNQMQICASIDVIGRNVSCVCKGCLQRVVDAFVPTQLDKELENLRHWHSVDEVRREMQGVDMTRIRFTLSPNGRWDLRERQVDTGPSVHDPHRYRPFETLTRVIADDIPLADFLNTWTKDNYVAIYSGGRSVIEILKDGRRVVRMATLKTW